VRSRLALLAVLALVVAGSAAAASAKRKLVRVVKRDGATIATLAYVRMGTYTFADARVSIRRNGRLVLGRKLCQPGQPRPYGCTWAPPARLAFRRVAGPHPAVVVDLYSGGNTCCTETFVALFGRHPHWIAHSFPGYTGRRIHGRYYLVSADHRFYCGFSVCAGSSEPVQVWTIDRATRFVDVTRKLPGLVRADARRTERALRPWHHRIDTGQLAPWCADEYLLGEGSRCSRALDYDLAHGYLRGGEGNMQGRPFIRLLNRDLVRWGYKRH
jgi:hypothetical protein